MADTSSAEESPPQRRQLSSKSLPDQRPSKSPATTSTSKAKGRSSRKPCSHPKYSEMITTAITTLKEKNGSSRHAILKYILHHYNLGDEKAVNSRLKAALKAGVGSKMIKQSTGIGASGSFSVTDAGRKAVAAKAGKRRSPPKAKKAVAATKKTAKSPKSKSPKSKLKTKSPKPKTKSPKAATKKPKKPKAKKEAGSPKKKVKKSKPKDVKPPASKQSKSKQAKPSVKKSRTEK